MTGGPPPAPMGVRGSRPVVFLNTASGAWLDGILEIPGVIQSGKYLYCSWDVAWAVARLLKVEEPPVPSWDGPLPGLDRYRELGLHERLRPYQKEDVLFLARRAWALLAEPMRSGKSSMALAASTLVGSRKTLVVCPQYARLGWADEVQLWLDESALLLCGRGGREARERCLVCRGRGMVADVACTACVGRNGQSLGYHIWDVPELTPRDCVDRVSGTIRWADVGRYSCLRHPEVTIFETEMDGRRAHCGACARDLRDAIARAKVIICNYELLVQQHVDLGGGQIGLRADLAGWVDVLKQYPIDVCIADEGHYLRGLNTSKRETGARNEKLFELVGVNRIPRVWIVTGTPFYGFVKDIFWLLEIASGGLWGGTRGMRGAKFLARYCQGKRTNFGYQAKGRSSYAEIELVRRLTGGPREKSAVQIDGIMIQRTREELFADTPPMSRTVVRLELEGQRPYRPGQMKRGGPAIADMIRQLNDAKREAVLDRFVDELSEGNKIIVFCFHVASAKKMFLALERAIAMKTVRTRMREVNAKIWLSTGPRRKDEDDGVALTKEQEASWATDGDARYLMAEKYREHVGAAILAATTDSMPGALSLRGAKSVHFLDLHWSPGAMAQAENRPWYPGVRDLSVVYYVAAESVDVHIEAEVLPKAETLARMGREQGAQAMLQAFGRLEEERTAESVYDRLVRHLRLDGESLSGA